MKLLKGAKGSNRLTEGLCLSPGILAEIGVETEGDKYDAGETGSEVHLFQESADIILATEGLPWTVVLRSELRRLLFSPSGVGTVFLLKLKPLKNPPGDKLLLAELCNALLLRGPEIWGQGGI